MNKLLKYSLNILISTYTLGAYSGGLNMFAQELVWNMSEQTSSLWSEEVPLGTPADLTNPSFNPKNVNFNWQKGFRGGIGYESDNHYWNSSFVWTYFPAQKSIDHRAGAQVIFPEFFSGFISGNYFFGADISWQMTMNMFDLITRHDIRVNDRLTLSPAIGIKGGTISQVIHTNWDAVLYTSKENVWHDYKGIGPSLGMGGKWNLYQDFNVIGNLSAAFMWGNWNIRDTYVRPEVLLVTTATTITTSMNQSKLGTLMLDYLIGLEWRHKGRSEIAVNLGYEMQYWANQLRMPTFQILPVHGDMTIQGATCGISIDF